MGEGDKTQRAEAARRSRLAAALRENLRRRKQARAVQPAQKRADAAAPAPREGLDAAARPDEDRD